MSKQKKIENVKNLLHTYLQYVRLQEDVRAVEAEIAGNSPVEGEAGGNLFTKALAGLKKDIQNERRRRTVQELTAERKAALEALAVFESRRGQKELAFARNPQQLKKLADKWLFQGDEKGVMRLQFALAFAVSDDREYQRPAQSLCAPSEFLFKDKDKLGAAYSAFEENFAYIGQSASAEGFPKGVAGVLSALALSVLPLGVVGAAAFFGQKTRQIQIRNQAKKLSGFEVNTLLAIQLTVIETVKKGFTAEACKGLTDRLLKQVQDLRADAEYEWLVEGMDIPACKQKIAVCEGCLRRLAQILGV